MHLPSRNPRNKNPEIHVSPVSYGKKKLTKQVSLNHPPPPDYHEISLDILSTPKGTLEGYMGVHFQYHAAAFPPLQWAQSPEAPHPPGEAPIFGARTKKNPPFEWIGTWRLMHNTQKNLQTYMYGDEFQVVANVLHSNRNIGNVSSSLPNPCYLHTTLYVCKCTIHLFFLLPIYHLDPYCTSTIIDLSVMPVLHERATECM